MAGERTRDLGFAHRFVPGADPTLATILLLHGTGGNENDLLPLGSTMLPGASLLSPRGRVLENGMPRFFRRLAEGVFDVEDLIVRAAELSRFVGDAALEYEFDPRNVYAVGFSNGANMAATLLLRHPGILRGAVLFRAMVPLEPPPTPDLGGIPVFLSAGRHDPLISSDHPERLAAILQQRGADVTLMWEPAGHSLTAREVEIAREWLARRAAAPSPA